MQALRLEPGTQVEIDGHVDEPFWERAERLGALTQVAPVEGADPIHPTDVRIAYDAKFLYVAIRCADDPSEVRARQMDRDAFVRYDDVMEIWFDTFDTQRFAYWFQITPGGSRGDALLSEGGGRFNKEWDGIWYGRSRVTADGWEAEVALPFQTLAFDADRSTWGFNIARRRVANGERSRWASPSTAFSFFTLAEGGALTGLTGLEQGQGIDVKPYVRLDASRAAFDGDTDLIGDGGLDLSWRPTPDVNVRFTANTDFAETEVDARQINLERFPLFFPEKRDFFLEDAGLFGFGAPGNRSSLIPFFSRTIGRDADGRAVPILAGVKATGRAGGWNVGLLDTYLDEHAMLGRENLGVLRVTRNVGAQSSIGGIVTTGDPVLGGAARTAGVDVRLADSRFLNDSHSASLVAWYLTTEGRTSAQEGDAFGIEASASSSVWNHTVSWQRIEEDFDPALGFVRRTGVSTAFAETQATLRFGDQGLIRTVESGLSFRANHDLAGNEDGWQLPLDVFEIEFQSGDSLLYDVTREHERLDAGFEVSPGVMVSPGKYEQVRHGLRFESNDRRLSKTKLSMEWGDFYSGKLLQWTAEGIWIPSKHVLVSLAFTDVEGDLAEGSFRTQLVSANLDLNLTPDVSWKNFAQYDTDSRDLSLQSRLRWILEPGQDLFLVGLFGWTREDRDTFVVADQELILKLTYTLRF